MPNMELLPELGCLSQLYAADCPEGCLLADYPSSNSPATVFQNRSRFIIHDPFPPPQPQLLKTLGPHHLMCQWGASLPVTSQLAPPPGLVDHWQRVLGQASCPSWQPWSDQSDLLTLFPHESIAATRQAIDPDLNYRLHSKDILREIDCPQPKILSQIQPPCIVKLSHGYAGLGNFIVRSVMDESLMRQQWESQWPDAQLFVTALVENIVSDVGAQFYLRRDGSVVWLGLTEQHFDGKGRWCGGRFVASQQTNLLDPMRQFVESTAACLHRHGYFGVVGIDVLEDQSGERFLVDVNPRLTGITPFLMVSRRWARDGITEGTYFASQNFAGSMSDLFTAAERTTDARVLILSAYEEPDAVTTICHLSVSSTSSETNQRVADELLSRDA